MAADHIKTTWGFSIGSRWILEGLRVLDGFWRVLVLRISRGSAGTDRNTPHDAPTPRQSWSAAGHAPPHGASAAGPAGVHGPRYCT